MEVKMKNTVFFVIICFLLVAPCTADTLIVSTEYPEFYDNIQAAIDDAVSGDLIVVFPGTYIGTGNVDITFLGKAITVQSIAPEMPEIVAATIIDCNNDGRGFYFGSGEDERSVLDGLTITNGSESQGGGIYIFGASPTLKNCVIAGNTGVEGGGIFCNLSYDLTLINCTITGNTALDNGGGIYFGSETRSEFINCTITGNTTALTGGGIYSYSGRMTFINCTIKDNTAVGEDGGGILFDEGGWPKFIDCVITGNTAARNGGGIYFGWNCYPEFVNCTITGNTAGDSGGGIYDESGYYLKLTNTVISANAAGNNGAGIYLLDNHIESYMLNPITGCTISSNQAGGIGGGIYSSGRVRLANSILWGNTDSSGSGQSAQIYNDGPDVINSIYSCIQDDDPCDTNIPFNEDNNYNIDDDPQFVRNPDDGGDGWGVGDNDDFGDLHLQKTSPCINAGCPNLLDEPNDLDIDGEPRVIGFYTDMGVDEFSKMVVVSRPEANDVWAADSLHEIQWSTYGISGTVDIYYSANGGAGWQIIENSVADSGSYLWQLPAGVDSGQCLVKVVPGTGASETVSIESGTFSINSYTPHPAVPGKWKSLGGNFRRTGLSENYGPEVGCIKWSFDTEGPVSASVTIGAGDRVHIACEDGKLYTLDADGSLVWSYDVNSALLSSPTISANGTVYAGSRDGKLYAISIGGSLLWTHAAYGVVYSSVAVSQDGNVYACSEDGVLYALDQDGSELWTFGTDGIGLSSENSILASPAIGADGTVYIGGLYDANLYALDANDGSVKWTCGFKSKEREFPIMIPTEGWPFASPVVGEDGTIYQTLLYDPNLYAIDANDGNIIWSATLGKVEYDLLGLASPVPGCVYGLSEPAIGPDGTIYVSLDDPNLRAVNPDGSIKWETPLGGVGGYTLTVGSDGLIYAACDDNYVYVVDADGEVVSQFQGDGWLSFPVIAADNTIIVSDVNNTVWAIEAGVCGAGLDMHRPQDLNVDKTVNGIDFAMLAAQWLDCSDQDGCNYQGRELYLEGDINHDLRVDFDDLAALAGRWLNID